jgi:hypothetical protein
MTYEVSEFVAECNRLAGQWIDSFQEPLEECVDILLEDNAVGFLTKKTPDGQQWPERKSGGSWPLLIKTDVLHAAATKRGSQGNVVRNDGEALEVGVEKDLNGPGGLPGVFVHQFGLYEANRVIPARSFVGASEDAQIRCEGVLGDYAEKKTFV